METDIREEAFMQKPPKGGGMLEDKAKPFHMLELCTTNLNVAYAPF